MSTRATKEKTGAEPRTKNRTLALALGGRATVAGWLGYGIGYSISRVEISPGLYIYILLPSQAPYIPLVSARI